MSPPLRVERLHLAEVVLPDWHPRAGDASCAVYAYLVEHRDGPIVVDTGVGRGHPAIDRLYRPKLRSLEDALGEREHGLDEVRLVINSHLHFDHCGQNHLFPGVPIVVQRREYEAAQAPAYTVREWVDFPGAVIEQVDGIHEVAEGVQVMPTPGHTPGHQSVVITADDGPLVSCAQAAYTPEEFAAGRSLDMDEAVEKQARESLQRLRSLEPSRVYFSHDSNEWTPATSPPGGDSRTRGGS